MSGGFVLIQPPGTCDSVIRQKGASSEKLSADSRGVLYREMYIVVQE